MKSRSFLFRFSLFSVLSLLLLGLFVSSAFAQSPAPVPTPAPTVLSGTTIAIALLSILAGYVSQTVNTGGSIFGIATLPKTWLPYVTLFGTFLTSSVVSISTAALKDENAWILALFAGLTAITGTTVGITARQHVSTGSDVMKAAAKTTGAALCLFGLAGAVEACTAAQVKQVFTDIEVACEAEVLASSVIPAGTEPAVVAQDVAMACNLSTTLLPDIEQVVVAYMGATLVAPSQLKYVPSPKVTAVRVRMSAAHP